MTDKLRTIVEAIAGDNSDPDMNDALAETLQEHLSDVEIGILYEAMKPEAKALAEKLENMRQQIALSVAAKIIFKKLSQHLQ